MCKILLPDDEGTTQAANQLIKGNVVIFPTETVYGLGANAHDKQAIEKIYSYKKRPKNNPLIIHSLSWDLAKLFTDVNDIELKIIKKLEYFWPGPLTILVKSSKHVLSEINNNSGMVAIRIPSNKIARMLLKKSGLSIVAPSANISGKFSSTTFDHAESYFRNESDISIIKSNINCEHGIESTIVKIENDNVSIVRPGIILACDLEKILGIKVYEHFSNYQSNHPGSDIAHYQTNKQAKLVNFIDYNLYEKPDMIQEIKQATAIYLRNSIFIDFGKKNVDKIDQFYAYVDLSESGDVKEALFNLYNVLYQINNIDNCNNLLIFNIFKDSKGLSRVMYDRLYRCSAGKELLIPFI